MAARKGPKVVSASRRTDLFTDENFPTFVTAFTNGYIDVSHLHVYCLIFQVPNPRSGLVSRVDLNPATLRAVVCWSKDYRNLIQHFIDHPDFEELMRHYVLHFQYTLNDEKIDDPLRKLEEHVTTLDERLSQVKWLAERFGPESINWRFDPITFWTDTTPG